MSSYIFLELDTTPPTIEMYSPRYTTNDIVNTITIESNESLSDYQEVYAIDSNGNRYDYTFEKVSPTQFVGSVKFANFPVGMVQLYAQMKDDVDNLSNIASALVEIKTGLKTVVAKVFDKPMVVSKVFDKPKAEVKVQDRSRKIVVYDTTKVGE